MKQVSYVLALTLAFTAFQTGGRAQTPPDPEQPLSLPFVADPNPLSVTLSAPVPFNMHRPPTIGPTVIVSPAQFFNSTDTALPLGLVGRSETAVAIGANGKNIVVGWNDPNGFLAQLGLDGLTGFAFSSDGGATFANGTSLPVGTFGGKPVVPRGDPWLDIAGMGNDTLYFANLAARPVTLAGVGITVHRGTVSGGSLSWASPAIITPPDSGDLLDKEAIAADKRGGSSAVYVTTTNFLTNGASRIELYRSLDAGNTWSAPTIVKAPDALGQQGSEPVVGPNGEVYVVWERGRFAPTQQILFRSSMDQGATFGPLDTVATFTGTSLFPPVGYNRTRSNDFPRIAVDFSTQHRGRIYVAYQDAGTNPKIHNDGVFFNQQTNTIVAATGGVRDGDIYLRFSDDGGTTWSTPTLVSSAAPGDGKNQFWPVVSVEPGGNVDVTYYQDTEVQPQPVNPLSTNISVGFPLRRQSSYRSFVDFFWAQSRDGGLTFQTPVQVNDSTSDWSIAASNIIPNFGDYNASVSGANSVFCTWGQSRLYDINPDTGVNNRFVPSAAFAQISGIGQAPFLQRPVLHADLPARANLAQNYPNPFNPATVITYVVPTGERVRLVVYNTLGEEIATLVDGYRDAGNHSAVFDARHLPSGVYYYRLTAGTFSSTQKMILAR